MKGTAVKDEEALTGVDMTFGVVGKAPEGVEMAFGVVGIVFEGIELRVDGVVRELALGVEGPGVDVAAGGDADEEDLLNGWEEY